ncbi:hypothetical protein SmJEL517_g00053 [Synchytrium microbalum]|uniref:Mitochondrial carrier domain-containing protein n=1 Tax=Synchytrium microbalum TaxID=1806994 RepID=A0A507CK50_9FUNG|nr:uncharacterized protein SmJEL517_g00053 [Synchytrium microbalum]TPX38265.1 hypothetical protein SmJEL517_g00053 [Synchytrium microbalum]
MPQDPYLPLVSSLLNQLDLTRFFYTIPSSSADRALRYTEEEINASNAIGHGYTLSTSSTDFSGLALQHYTLAVILSPLQVAEILSQVQYWKRPDRNTASSPEEEELPLGAEAASFYNDEDGVSVIASESRHLYHPRLARLQDGLVENWKHIVHHPDEGWTALLKGHVTGFIEYMAFSVLQPAVEETLNDVFDVYDDVHPITLTVSHVIVGGILSPLELIKTRIIVQSSPSNRKKYHNPIHAASTIVHEENGTLSTLYSTRHLFPSITLHALRPLLRYISTTVMESNMGLSWEYTPIFYLFSRLAFLGAETLVMTPLEFAKRRLECQRLGGRNVGYYGSRGSQYGGGSQAGGGSQYGTPNPLEEWTTPIPTDNVSMQYAMPFDAAVDLAPFRYRGMLDVIYTVVATESATYKRKRVRRRTYSGTSFVGLHSDGEWTQVRRLSPSRPPSNTATTTNNNINNLNQQLNDPWNSTRSINTTTQPASSAIRGIDNVARPIDAISETGTQVVIETWSSWISKLGGGVKTLYRGFWPRYVQSIIIYGFEAMNKAAEDDLF